MYANCRDFAKAQIEAGCDLIGIGDAICSRLIKKVMTVRQAET